MFRTGSTEHRSVTIEHDNLKKLDHFANRFGMSPAVAYVLSIVDQHVIHVLLMPVAELQRCLHRVAGGYALRFHKDADLAELAKYPSFGYTQLSVTSQRSLPPLPNRRGNSVCNREDR